MLFVCIYIYTHIHTHFKEKTISWVLDNNKKLIKSINQLFDI